jgi:hypothetical protein
MCYKMKGSVLKSDDGGGSHEEGQEPDDGRGSHEEFEVQAPDDVMGSHVEVPETDDGGGSHEEVQDGIPSITKPEVLPSNSLSELPNVSFFYI